MSLNFFWFGTYKIEHLAWKRNMFFDKPFGILLSVLCSQQSLYVTFIVFPQKLSTDTLTQSKYSTVYLIVLGKAFSEHILLSMSLRREVTAKNPGTQYSR